MDMSKVCGLVTSPHGNEKIDLTEAHVQCQITSLTSNVTSILTYVNQLDKSIDSKFVFPLVNLVVYSFEAHIQDRVIVAECRPREEAQKTFEDAVESGHFAFLAEQDVRCEDLFQISLGNIPPKETVKITLKYAGHLQAENLVSGDSELSQAVFILPTVINPRYTPPTAEIETEFDPFVLYQATNSAPYSILFEASVCVPEDIVEVSSKNDTYHVELDKKCPRQAKVKLQSEFRADHDLQMIIKMNRPLRSFVAYEPGDLNKSSLLSMDCLMAQFMPDFSKVQSQQERRTELVFVIDRSGSMHGSSISCASESLLLFLKALPVGCRFQIIGFGSTHSALFDEPVDYNEQTLQRALDYQKSMQADMGGTEVLPALKEALDAPLTGQGWYRQVIFITDGDVGNVNEIIGLVGSNVHKARVFSIGIKTCNNLVSEVSRAGRGISAFILEDSKLRGVVMKILRAALQPRADDVIVNWDLKPTDGSSLPVSLITVPKKIPPAFHNCFVSVFGLLPSGSLKKLTGQAVFQCEVMSEKQAFTVDIRPANDIQSSIPLSDAPLHRLAGKCQLSELGDQHKSGLMSGKSNDDPEMESLRNHIVKISCAVNILSPFTGLVGVDPVKREPVLKVSKREEEFSSICNQSGFPRAGVMLCSAAAPMMMDCCAMRVGSSNLSPSQPRMAKKTKGGFAPLFSRKKSSNSPSSEREESSSPKDINVALVLAELQNIDGSWSLNEKLAKTFNISLAVLEKSKPAKWPSHDSANLSELVWATALVISYLELRAADMKDEWDLLVTKSMSWLTSQAQEVHKDPSQSGKLCKDLLLAAEKSVLAGYA